LKVCVIGLSISGAVAAAIVTAGLAALAPLAEALRAAIGVSLSLTSKALPGDAAIEI